MNGLKKQWLIWLILPVILLSGCGSILVSAASTGEEPTMLQVQRVNSVNAETGNHYPPFASRTITNQQVVQRLYNVMQALPPFTISNPPGWLSCPHGTDVTYQLDFLHEHSLIREVMYSLSGCPTLRIGKNDVRTPDKSFAQLLAQAVGVSVNDLAPAPLFSCNIHSPCLSPTP